MNTVYTNEAGVRPWESIHPTQDARFITITLIDHDFESLWESWCNLMEPLSEQWPIKRKWYSTLTSGFHSKTEEYLFKKYMAKIINSGDISKANETSNIHSTIQLQPNAPRAIEKLAFEASQDVILVMKKTEPKIDELWSQMTIFEKIISPANISSFLISQPNTVLSRFYDTDTHAAAQFIFQADHGNQTISETVTKLFKKINPEDIHHYINNTKKL